MLGILHVQKRAILTRPNRLEGRRRLVVDIADARLALHSRYVLLQISHRLAAQHSRQLFVLP